MNSFYTKKELSRLGLKSHGENVLISKKCSIYNAKDITIGNNVRIDDFCILSGKITIGNYVHISAFCSLYGKLGIEIGNFCGLSPRCTIFSATDDFSGEHMISPMVPEAYTDVHGGLVKILDYVQVGTNSIVMTGVTIGEGSAIGAFSFITKDVEPWHISFGIPGTSRKKRSKKLLEYAKKINNK